MKQFTLKVSDKKLSYQIPINNKVVVIAGFSGTGKTTLYSLIQRASRGIYGTNIESNLPVMAGSNNKETAKYEILSNNECLIVFDEDCDLLNPHNKRERKEYGEFFRNSNNIFILITRNTLDIPLPQDSYFELVTRNGIHVAQPLVEKRNNKLLCSEKYLTIVEDSSSAYEFMEEYLSDKIDPIDITTSDGAANMCNTFEKYYASGRRYFNLVYDFLGAGFFIKRLNTVLKKYQGVHVNIIDWLSFEYYILQSKNLVDHALDTDDIFIYNKEEFVTQQLMGLLHYTNSYKNSPCITLMNVCRACPEYQYCKFSVDNRKLNYLHSPLIDDTQIPKQFQVVDFLGDN